MSLIQKILSISLHFGLLKNKACNINQMEQEDLKRRFRSMQEKYVYYVIALCVSSLGYSIYITLDQPLKYSQIPLGAAVLMWGISIYCGLRFLTYVLSTIYAKYAYNNVVIGNDPDDSSKSIEQKAKGIMRAMEANQEVAGKYFKWQKGLFLVGMVLFFVWHVLEMYFRTAK